MNIRAFFALPLKPAVVRRLADHADSLCAHDSEGRVEWSDSDNYHLTLCFLGDIGLEQVVALEELVFEALAGQESFQVGLKGAEYFNVNSGLALVAARSEPCPELMALQRRMAQVVRSAGLAVPERDFTPHVTLGRLEAGRPFPCPQNQPELELQTLADAVVLYQSKPGRNGSIYTPLFEISLGTGSQEELLSARAQSI
ncbi:RNA 2',3'-cyclic phosphodiesterase [Motiliproteus sp. SC1-56]|uniref:RNA 2',3'-cyclic phosphodiesterase n=1 Tax=Motiliproteus sp. SC1-56 TaxID=2799565 RepID=UPI001A8DA965|nr:RNA 2',3'-cyclic phosphodiesterase [Motiliproteus sp. SC1-56]